MSRICYSQNFEDVILWRVLNHVQDGRYLDIGAQDPHEHSVSKSFHLAGWRGVHVEATPHYAQALRENRLGDVVIQAVVGDGTGLASFFVFSDTGLSTGISSIADGHHRAGRSFERIEVPTISLESLLDQFGGEQLHWLKIDVEGMEESVLKSWGEAKCRPWVIVIEAIEPITLERRDQQWRRLLEGRNYTDVMFDGVNLFFLADEHAELASLFSAPANYLDPFWLPADHWTAVKAAEQSAAAAAERERAIAERDARLSAMASEQSVLANDLQTARDQQLEALKASERQTAHFATVEADLIALSLTKTAQIDALATQLGTSSNQIGTLIGQVGASIAQIEALTAQLAASAVQLGLKDDALNRAGDRQAEATAAINSLRREIVNAHAELATRAQLLLQADQIVALARERIKPWHIRIAKRFSPSGRRKFAQLRFAIAAWHLAPQSIDQANNKSTKFEGNAMDMFSFDDRNPYERVDTLAELCSFSDLDFIRCAYVTILGRQPDPSGEAAYIRRLRAGSAKLSIIGDLRRSSEGKQHDPGIAGLDRALRKHRHATLPVVGWFVRQVTGRVGEGPIERSIRILENKLDTDRKISTQRFSLLHHLVFHIDQKVALLDNIVKPQIDRGMTSVKDVAEAVTANDGNWQSAMRNVLDN